MANGTGRIANVWQQHIHFWTSYEAKQCLNIVTLGKFQHYEDVKYHYWRPKVYLPS